MKNVVTAFGDFFAALADPYFRSAVGTDLLDCIARNFLQLFPYVVLGCLLGEALKFTSWTGLIYRFTAKRRALAVLFATVLGILSPLCTYGTVPVLLSLYGAGVAPAPLVAFLAASSMMNPQLFVMTYGGLGAEMALWRLFLVFLFSCLCGFLSLLLPEKFLMRAGAKREEGGLAVQKKEFRIGLYAVNVLKNLWFVGRMMLLGVFLAALFDILPVSALFGEVNTQKPLGVLLAAMAGIPVYACGGGTVPMIAALMKQGMSRGSALAFLTVGPATRITSLAAIATVFRKRFLLLYVAFLLLFSVAAGILLV